MTAKAQYLGALQNWATQVPPDMAGEDNKEKLLDAALRLFESLDRPAIRKFLRQQAANKTGLLLAAQPAKAAWHWQVMALSLDMPKWLLALLPDAMAVMLLRWMPLWLGEKGAASPRLMALVDQDITRMQKAIQLGARLRFSQKL